MPSYFNEIILTDNSTSSQIDINSSDLSFVDVDTTTEPFGYVYYNYPISFNTIFFSNASVLSSIGKVCSVPFVLPTSLKYSSLRLDLQLKEYAECLGYITLTSTDDIETEPVLFNSTHLFDFSKSLILSDIVRIDKPVKAVNFYLQSSVPIDLSLSGFICLTKTNLI